MMPDSNMSSPGMPDSLWRHTAIAARDTVAYKGDSKVDVVIVGGGFTGLRAALELSGRGLSIIVLESGDIGWGASGRSGGQVNPIIRLTSAKIASLIGEGPAERFIRSTINSADEVFNLIRQHRIACAPVQNGWLQVAHCLSAAQSLEELALDWRRHGSSIEFKSDQDLYTESGTASYQMGLFHPKAGHLQPMSYVRGLANAAMKANVQVHTHSRVEKIEPKNGGWRVAANGGSIQTEWVLLCTNGYTKGLHQAVDKSYLPFTPIQLATAPLSETMDQQILPGNQSIADTRRLIFYGRKTADRRLIFGGLGKGVNNLADYERIKKEAVRIYPILKGIAWDYQWGGNIAMTMDALPHVHRLAPGLLAGLGCNGRGVAMSTVMGRVLSECVLGSETSLDLPLLEVRKIGFRNLKSFTIPYGLPVLGWLDRRDK